MTELISLTVYKFNEQELLKELCDYVDSTYLEHYSQDDIQALEAIASSGNGIGFVIGDIIKYAMRYRHKYDTPEQWRTDLMKIAHYAILALWCHDKEYKNAAIPFDNRSLNELFSNKSELNNKERRDTADE